MSTTNERTLTLTRRFKAPPERVFAAFTTLDALSLWFGPDDSCSTTGELDFQVGGRYRLIMDSPKFGQNTAIGTYREIVPPSKVVFTWKWEADEDWQDCESLITVELRAHGEETEMFFTQVGFPNDESPGNHHHGWQGSFDRLDRTLHP